MIPFIYTPRTETSLCYRMFQSENSFPSVEKPLKVRRSAPKLGPRTLCLCGHARKDHCLENRQHFPEGGWFSCITEHCNCLRLVSGENHLEPCPCTGFRATADAQPIIKRPEADDYTLCAACGHPRNHHCRVQRKEDRFSGFSVNGEPAICKHFDRGANPATYHCTTTACAESEDGMTFCGCKKFVSPYLVPKKRALQPHTRKQANAKQPFVTGQVPLALAAKTGTANQRGT